MLLPLRELARKWCKGWGFSNLTFPVKSGQAANLHRGLAVSTSRAKALEYQSEFDGDVPDKWMTINNYTAFNGGYLLESRDLFKRLCNYFCLCAYPPKRATASTAQATVSILGNLEDLVLALRTAI